MKFIKSVKLKQKLERVALNPLFGAITALVTIAAGGLSSFFADDIKHSLLPFFVEGRVFSLPATLFWISVLSAGGCLGLSQWAQARSTRRSTDKLETMVRRLETLPAETYLPAYQSTYRSVAMIAMATMRSSDVKRDALVGAIQKVMSGIATIAYEFDRRPSQATYSANVMMWREEGRNLAHTPPQHLIHHTAGDERISGLLEALPELSVNVDHSDDMVPADDGLGPMLLPVAKESEAVVDVESGRTLSPVLPGAPWAFTYKKSAMFRSIEEFFRLLDTSVCADPRDIKTLKEHFAKEKGSHIKSFCSFPLLRVGLNADTAIPFAVLNLHSTEEGILQDNGVTLFAPLLEPFLILLTNLLFLYEELRPSSKNEVPNHGQAS